VTYTGAYLFADVTGTGTNYWTPFPTTYADGVRVDNGPALSDTIGLFEGDAGTCIVTFSRPVVNPVMAIVSLGRDHVVASSVFNVPFDVVASGAGYFGDGYLIEDANKTVRGAEGNGTIQFVGPVNTIRWTIPLYEYWYGFTIGIPLGENGYPQVPVPGTLLLVSLGTILVGYLQRRRAW
jgi:hypothetical protein